VRAFAAFFGRSPDMATAEDLRRFQLHQTQIGMQPPSINSAVAALRFFFNVTLDRRDLAWRLAVVREPRRLPAVLSVEEVTLLLQAAHRERSTRRRSPPPTAPDCAFPTWSRSRSVTSRRTAECLARVEDQVAVGSRTPAAAAHFARDISRQELSEVR
jgi:hypothetical protein